MDMETLKRVRAGFPLSHWEVDDTIKLLIPKPSSGLRGIPTKIQGNSLPNVDYEPGLPPLKGGVTQVYLVLVIDGTCELWKIGLTRYPIRERFRLDINEGRIVRRLGSYRYRNWKQAYEHEQMLLKMNQGIGPGAFPLFSGGNSETFNKLPHWQGKKETKAKRVATNY